MNPAPAPLKPEADEFQRMTNKSVGLLEPALNLQLPVPVVPVVPIVLVPGTGTRYWNQVLELGTGTRYWN